MTDRRLSPVAVGAAGELLLGGAGLARGYRGRPAVTATSFLPDPFSGLSGARLYRTGDLVRHRPDGALEFVGRTDEQVKVRGFRIEPGEIAAALTRHPGVGEAAVVARQMGGGTPGGVAEHDVRLVAYLVPPDGEIAAAPAAGELRRFLQERLPEHMVPAFFVPLEALPLTRHGKLDRRALPQPEAPRPAGEAEVATPRNETERTLVRLWREVLGVERVGVRDNFFELGGDSLLLLRVHEGLASELGVEIPVLELFRYPTVETLATRLGSGEGQGRSLDEVGSEAARRADRAAQRRQQLRQRRRPPRRTPRRPGTGR